MQLLHALTQDAYHLYLGPLPMRRAATHFADSAHNWVNHAQQGRSPPGYIHQTNHPGQERHATLPRGHVYGVQTVPNMRGAALSSKVLEYISMFCQDPMSALRIKVDVPPMYR